MQDSPRDIQAFISAQDMANTVIKGNGGSVLSSLLGETVKNSFASAFGNRFPSRENNIDPLIKKLNSLVETKTPLTASESVHLIKNNPYALAGFMVSNNPGSLNYILRSLGYDHLGFEPDAKALVRQMDLLIKNNRAEDLSEIVKNFKIDSSKLSDREIVELKKAL